MKDEKKRNIWRLHHFPAVIVSVAIDELTYDPAGNGVATLDGNFFIYNLHPDDPCNYNGELRLEILKPIGDDKFLTFTPDAKQNVSGNLKNWNENRQHSEVSDNFSESVNLNIDCLSNDDDDEIEIGDTLTMSASITLTATINTEETWSTTYTKEFTHEPSSAHGL